MGKYSERCEAEGIVFIPLVVDRFGGWHKDSLEVVTKLGRHFEKEEEEIMRQLNTGRRKRKRWNSCNES